jgi:hypothetical protein
VAKKHCGVKPQKNVIRVHGGGEISVGGNHPMFSRRPSVAPDITAQVVRFGSLVKMKESMRGAGPDELKARIKESKFTDLLNPTATQGLRSIREAC